MREYTAEIEGTMVTYYVQNLAETMREALAAAKRAEKDATQADLYKQQVDLEYSLTHTLRDIERLDHEIQALRDERDSRLHDVQESSRKSWEVFHKALTEYATVEDIEGARQDYEGARDEAQDAERTMNELFEQYSTAQEKYWKAEALRQLYQTRWDQTKTTYVKLYKPGAAPPENAEVHQKARLEFRKGHTRLELEKSDIENDYAGKILELRKKQNDLALAAKKQVDDAEKAFAKKPAGGDKPVDNVVPIKAAGTK